METAKRKFTYTLRHAYATHTDRIRTHGNGPLKIILIQNSKSKKSYSWIKFPNKKTKHKIHPFNLITDILGKMCQ